jgi:hypothetical protein
MKITLESTDEFCQLDGVQVRLWTGTTQAGRRVSAFIAALAVLDGDDPELARELVVKLPPDDDAPVIELLKRRHAKESTNG